MTPSKHSSSKPLIRAALYARISALHHGQDPEVQLGELREFCRRRGFIVAHEYVDTGISGSRERRPALDKLLADCRKRPWMPSSSTVTTALPEALTIGQQLGGVPALGIEFISIHEGVDTSTPVGRLCSASSPALRSSSAN